MTDEQDVKRHPTRGDTSSDPTPEFGEITVEQEKDMGGYLAEEEAVDLQCLIDGDSDRDRAAVMREEVHTQREVYQFLLEESRRRSALLTFEEALQLVTARMGHPVADSTVFAAYELLRDGDGEEQTP